MKTESLPHAQVRFMSSGLGSTPAEMEDETALNIVFTLYTG